MYVITLIQWRVSVVF